MESYAPLPKNTTLEDCQNDLFLDARKFLEWPHAGIVVQAYRVGAEPGTGFLWDMINWGRARGTRFTVRLVKGAYWELRADQARQNAGHPRV